MSTEARHKQCGDGVVGGKFNQASCVCGSEKEKERLITSDSLFSSLFFPSLRLSFFLQIDS